MSKYFFKYFPNVLVSAVIFLTFLGFIFQQVSINATRDRKSDEIRRNEEEREQLKEKIMKLQSDLDSLCNAEKLRGNLALPADFSEVPNQEIIRVRTKSIPCGGGTGAVLSPQDLAIDLTELAALAKR